MGTVWFTDLFEHAPRPLGKERVQKARMFVRESRAAVLYRVHPGPAWKALRNDVGLTSQRCMSNSETHGKLICRDIIYHAPRRCEPFSRKNPRRGPFHCLRAAGLLAKSTRVDSYLPIALRFVVGRFEFFGGLIGCRFVGTVAVPIAGDCLALPSGRLLVV